MFQSQYVIVLGYHAPSPISGSYDGQLCWIMLRLALVDAFVLTISCEMGTRAVYGDISHCIDPCSASSAPWRFRKVFTYRPGSELEDPTILSFIRIFSACMNQRFFGIRLVVGDKAFWVD